jgi:hypothetical protein
VILATACDRPSNSKLWLSIYTITYIPEFFDHFSSNVKRVSRQADFTDTDGLGDNRLTQ